MMNHKVFSLGFFFLMVSSVLPIAMTTNAQIASPCASPTITGTEGNDYINGTSAVDVIDAKGGNDVIYGHEEADIICGGPGEDLILAGQGNDIAQGGYNNDFIMGDEEDDVLHGNTGNDMIVCGGGSNGDGKDILNAQDLVANNDFLFGGLDTDTCDSDPDTSHEC